MLATSAEHANRFTRRDALRLILASVLLVAAMSLILGLDFLPAQTQLEVDKPAPSNVQAPRAGQYTSVILTEQQRRAARDAVEPQYDYTIEHGTVGAPRPSCASWSASSPPSTPRSGRRSTPPTAP